MDAPAPRDGVPALFDDFPEDRLRAAGSLKWTRYGPAIGAWVAEMDLGTAPAVTQVLHDAVDQARFGYLPTSASDAMARACSGWQARRYGWDVPAERIFPLPDVIAGLQAVIEHFTPPGSAVVLPTPAYMPFRTVPGLLGRESIEVPMVEQDGRATFDLDGSTGRCAPAPGWWCTSTRTTRSAASSPRRSSSPSPTWSTRLGHACSPTRSTLPSSIRAPSTGRTPGCPRPPPATR